MKFLTALLIPLSLLLLSGTHPKEKPAGNQEIKWLSFEEAMKMHQKKPKKIFIDIYTDWCGWCKVMNKQTFTDPQIIDYMNRTFYPVKLNAETRDTINFKGKDYTFFVRDSVVLSNGRVVIRGYHQLAKMLMNGKLSYPTIVFLDEQLNVIQPIPGFRKPPELDRFLKFFGNNYYRRMDYQSFENGYVSPYED